MNEEEMVRRRGGVDEESIPIDCMHGAFTLFLYQREQSVAMQYHVHQNTRPSAPKPPNLSNVKSDHTATPSPTGDRNTHT